jgi:hypothetical protein
LQKKQKKRKIDLPPLKGLKKGKEVNKVQLKALELINLASAYGIESRVILDTDSYIRISFASENLKVSIRESEAGNALVKTWERKHLVPNSSLEPKLSWYKAIKDRREARKG